MFLILAGVFFLLVAAFVKNYSEKVLSFSTPDGGEEAVSKAAKVKEIYIEQEYEVLNDSVFLLKRDYMMSDFSFSKKEESKGVYGKRTTLAKNHKFNIKKDDKFYKQEVNFYDNAVFNKGVVFDRNAVSNYAVTDS